MEIIKEKIQVTISIVFVAILVIIAAFILLIIRTNKNDDDKTLKQLFDQYIIGMQYERINQEKFQEISDTSELENSSYFKNLNYDIYDVEDYDNSIGLNIAGKQYFLFCYNVGGKEVKQEYVGEFIGNGKIKETDYNVYKINGSEDYIAIQFSGCEYKFVFYEIKDVEVSNFAELLGIYGDRKYLEISEIFANIYEKNMQVGCRYFNFDDEKEMDIWNLIYEQSDKEVLNESKSIIDNESKYYENIMINIYNKETGMSTLALRFDNNGKLIVNSKYVFDTDLEFYEELVKYINEECKAYIYKW